MKRRRTRVRFPAPPLGATLLGGFAASLVAPGLFWGGRAPRAPHVRLCRLAFQLGWFFAGAEPQTSTFLLLTCQRGSSGDCVRIVGDYGDPEVWYIMSGKVQAATFPKDPMTEEQRATFAAFVGRLRSTGR